MRFTLPDDKQLVLEMTIPVRWGDMDAMGHVNNTLYFRYFEIIRLEWLARACDIRGRTPQGPVIVNAFCNFVRQVTFPCELLARLYVGNPGRSSFDTFVTLAPTDRPDEVHAEGGATTVWVDHAAEKSVPLPESVRALFG